jgi:dTDP-4-amino-4,6-dideoxygalactose transaminase
LTIPFIDIKAQYEELKSDLDAAVLEVISSGAYILGKHNTALEAEIAGLHGCKHGIAVNSGTDALRIMMDAAGIGPGDEVITTAFTFVASTETIVQTGAKPVFVDIEDETFQIDPGKIEAAVTPRTKAILPIHLFGQICEMGPIMAIAEKHGLSVLEDAAQAIGARQNGTPAGAFGLAGGFSFYVTKNLGAAGDGGLIVTNSDDIAERCRSIRIHGMGRERYYYDHVGYTSRMAEVQAAVLRVKLGRLASWNRRRTEIAEIYRRELEGSGVRLPRVAAGNEATWHQYTILSDRRDELQAFLKDRGVPTMIYYPVPLHFHKPYSHLGFSKGDLPVTERVCETCLSLPVHQNLSEEQAMAVCHAVREFSKSAVSA